MIGQDIIMYYQSKSYHIRRYLHSGVTQIPVENNVIYKNSGRSIWLYEVPFDSKEDKLKIINKVLLNCKSTEEVAKEYDISGGMLRNWIIKYNQYGEDSLENKKKPGNPLMKYSAKKNLTDIEKLQYENMRLRIENERLKKGYLVKGDGSVVVYKK